jgi:hypothetical protein
VPLKGRCEIIDASLPGEQHSWASKAHNLLHFSEATNEIYNAIRICELAVGKSGVPKHSQEKSAPRESGKGTQQRVVFSNACDFPVHVTGTAVELGGECHNFYSK